MKSPRIALLLATLGWIAPCLPVAALRADLTITKVTDRPFGDTVKILHDIQDTGGTTSIRFFPPRTGEPDKDEPDEFIYDSPTSKPRVYYYTRDRDLGQVFTVGASPVVFGALTLRTGPSDTAVRAGAQGARVFMQLYQVTGTPVLNNHGTTGRKPDEPADGKYTRWATFNPADHRTDDYIEGITLTRLTAFEGDLPTGLTKNQWLRFEIAPSVRPTLQAGLRYAWLIGFVSSAVDRSVSFANTFSPGAPSRDYPGGHGLRRDGSTLDLEATFVRDINDEADKETSRRAASFSPVLAERLARPPFTFGFPDVEGYRDFRFFIEEVSVPVEPPPPVVATYALTTARGRGGDTQVGSNVSGEARGVTEPGLLRARSDANIYKAYLRFDLAALLPPGAEVGEAALELVRTEATLSSALLPGLGVTLWGLPDATAPDADGAWAENTLTWTSSLSAGLNDAAATTAASGAVNLGTIDVSAGWAAGAPLVFGPAQAPGLAGFLRADTNGLATFALTYSLAGEGSSFKAATKEHATYAAPRLTLGAGARYSGWADAVFPVDTPETDRSPLADPDADGLVNLLEDALAAAPLSADSAAAPVVATAAGGDLVFTYRRARIASDLTYVLQTTTDLAQAWETAVPSATRIVSDDGVVQVVEATVPVGATGRRFLRLRVSQIP